MAACEGRSFETGGGGDNARWAEPDFRRSPDAVISLDATATVRLTRAAVQHLERAMDSLVLLDKIAERWDRVDLWPAAASAVASIPPEASGHDLQVHLAKRLQRIEQPGPGVVCFVVSGAHWDGGPRVLSDIVLGRADADWRKQLDLTAGTRPTPLPGRRTGFLARVSPEGSGAAHTPLVAGTWVEGTHRRGVRQARERFGDLLRTSLLFRTEVDAALALSLRGLGIEPIDLARGGAVAARDRFGDATIAPVEHPPQPKLDDLLEFGVSRGLVEASMSSRSALARRLRICARWHLRALQADDPGEAVCALWTAFDALLGDGSAMPDKAIANRYAVLAPTRDEVQPWYTWLVGHLREARNAATHGGESVHLSDQAFTLEAAARLRVAADRLWGVLVSSGTTRDDDYGESFRALKTQLTG